MLALEFFRWWYGQGWAMALGDAKRRVSRLSQNFSVTILLRTLFAPWKRIISNPGVGIDGHLRAAADNAISRLVGFFVRLSVLIWVGLLFAFFLVLGFVQLILWPLLPLAAVVLIVKGLL